MTDTIKNTVSIAKDVLNSTPKIYEDCLGPIAKPSGETLGLIPRAIKASLAPLEKWILNREYSIEETKNLLEKKLNTRNPENITSPEPYVAVPAIQGISYCANSIDLRNLYANLLANSMDTEVKDNVHPSFVEIIKQLSPLEARLLKNFSTFGSLRYPICKIRFQESEIYSSGVDVCFHILSHNEFDINIENHESYSIAIDNLIRLKLINVDYQYSFTDKAVYDDFENSDILNFYNSELNTFLKNNPEKNILNYCKLGKGTLEITNLGRLFIEICVE